MDSKKIGSLVKDLREERGILQDGLAGLLGISRSAVVNIENGNRKLSATELIRMAEIFGLSIDQLVRPELRPEFLLESVKEGEPGPETGPRISIPQNNHRKFREVLLYILSRLGARPHVGETVLYKLLYFIDFDYYEKYEEQLIGADYIKNRYGPTPVFFRKLVEQMAEDGEIERVSSTYFDYPQTKYLPLREPELSVLNGRELDLIEDVICRLGEMNAKQLGDYSHRDVPWMSALEGKPIEYEIVFYRTPEYSVRSYPEDGGD
jgi:transcriptional regulator with XRE-family HTH domain